MRLIKLIVSLFFLSSLPITDAIADCHFKHKPHAPIAYQHVAMQHLNYYINGDTLDLHHSDITDTEMTTVIQYLRKHPEITNLNLDGCNKLTAATYVQLPTINSLTVLNLARTTRGGVEHDVLKASDMQAFAVNTSLRKLNLNLHRIEDAGAKLLAKNKKITDLSIEDNGMTDVGAVALLKDLPLWRLDLIENDVTLVTATVAAQSKILKQLSIRFWPYQDSDQAGYILASSPSLEDLEIFWIKDHAAIALSQNPNIHTLRIEGSFVVNEGLSALAQDQHLTTLDLVSCGCPDAMHLDDAAVQKLAQSKTIKALNLDEQNLTSKGVLALSKMPELTQLNLFYNREVDDAAVMALVNNAKKLESLDISFSKVTDRGALALAQSKTLKKLSIADTQITNRAALAFSNNTALESLDLAFNKNVSDVGALAFANTETLNALDLYGIKLSTFTKIALRNNQHLKELDLSKD